MVHNSKDGLTRRLGLFDSAMMIMGIVIGSGIFLITGIMANSDGGLFLYIGLLYDIPINSFLYVTPSFSPGLYYKSNSKELGFTLNFRSQIEMSLKFENDFRFGISFNHISNGTLGNINPGVESLALSMQFPF